MDSSLVDLMGRVFAAVFVAGIGIKTLRVMMGGY